MRILKLTLGKIIFLQIFLWISAFQCEVFWRTWLTIRTQAALPIANLAVYRPDELVTHPGAILTGFYLSLSFSASRTPLHFYWFILSCCVFLSRISPEILTFYAHLFSFHDILCLPLFFEIFVHFRILEYFWNIVNKDHNLSVCLVDIDISGSFGLQYLLMYFWHPIDSRHNTTLFFD